MNESASDAETVARALADIFPRMMESLARLGGSRSSQALPLTAPQLKALYAIHVQGDEMQMSELAEALGITQSTATDVTKRLVRLGYLIKKRPSGDKRVVCVSLSAKGQKIVQEMQSEKFQQFLRICEALPKAARQRLLKSHQLILGIYSAL
jgi:DNA-binding MarR family transcriptional regulator